MSGERLESSRRRRDQALQRGRALPPQDEPGGRASPRGGPCAALGSRPRWSSANGSGRPAPRDEQQPATLLFPCGQSRRGVRSAAIAERRTRCPTLAAARPAPLWRVRTVRESGHSAQTARARASESSHAHHESQVARRGRANRAAPRSTTRPPLPPSRRPSLTPRRLTRPRTGSPAPSGSRPDTRRRPGTRGGWRAARRRATSAASADRSGPAGAPSRA